MTRHRTVLLLVAAASATGEAGLPFSAHLRDVLLKAAELHDICDLSGVDDRDLSGVLRSLAPEALLLVLEGAGVPVESVLLRLFNQADASPNAVHQVAAHAAAAGTPVWTTNYDTLVEEAALAAGLRLSVATAPSDDEPGDSALVKVHGSFVPRTAGHAVWVEASDLIFTATRLVNGLPAPYEERLLADIDGSHLVVLGYAGADVDLFPVLRRAIRVAARVSWFDLATPERATALGSRYGLRAAGPAGSNVTAT